MAQITHQLTRTGAPDRGGGRNIAALLVCFTLSGMSGLIYEVAWVRSLELIFGTTTFAVATVLAAFMGGLALGSFFMGRRLASLERFHPLRLYAAMEILIAVVALLIPLGLHAIVPLYQLVWKTTHASFITFSLIRFGLSALVLLAPTFLMGATLPVVSKYVSTDSTLGQKRTSLLYAFNTLGAVLGCLAAGLVLFPTIGLAKTQWIAVLLNLTAAAGAFLLANKSESPFTRHPAPVADRDEGDRPVWLSRRDAALLVTIYSVSGFIAMLYEVAWTRVLVLAFGSSTYAYTIMLATFLLGLAGGAWLATKCLRRTDVPLLAAGLCQLGIALTTYLSVFLVEEMPYFYVRSFEILSPSPKGLLNIQFLLAASLMILPTLGLGAMFPITLRALNPTGRKTARTVGWAYSLNTLGAIAGSVLAGFWLVPYFGTQNTLLGGIALNALLALFALIAIRTRPLARIRYLTAAAVLLFAASLFYSTPKWDPSVLSSGVFRYVNDYRGLSRLAFRERARKIAGEVLMFEEGLTCTVTVSRNPEVMSLAINGKPDASTPSGLRNPFETNAAPSLQDLPTQMLLGHLPLLLAPRRDQVLLVGLGSGLTLGSVLTHPVKHVECIELEKAVVHGSQFFEQYNGRPLSDPRAELIVNDARNHLLVTANKYNVIISEPSNPWLPGAAKMFTREAFESCKLKLETRGIFCQWIQLYELRPKDFQIILATFTSVFPEAQMFRVNHDAILVGSLEPLVIDAREMSTRFSPAVRLDLERIRIHSLEELLAYFWIGGKELQACVPPLTPNTDDNMLIEFAAPLQVMAGHGNTDPSGSDLKKMFDAHASGIIPELKLPQGTDQAGFWAALSEATLSLPAPVEASAYANFSLSLSKNPRATATRAKALEMLKRKDQAWRCLTEGERNFPDSPVLLRTLALFCSQDGRWTEARRYAERALTQEASDPVAQFYLGRSLYYLKEPAASLAVLQKIKPGSNAIDDFKNLPFYLGALNWERGNYKEAVEHHRIYLKSDPAHLEARAQLADALYHLGQRAEAVRQWQRIGQLNAGQAAVLFNQAETAWQQGKPAQASEHLEAALKLDAGNTELVLLLARWRFTQGDLQGAADLLETHLSWNPDRPLAVGLLSQVLAGQNKLERSQMLAARYRALTGEALDGPN